MKITKEDLQQIIKEELENVLLEQEEAPLPPFDIDLADAAVGFIGIYVDDRKVPTEKRRERQEKYENAERQLFKARKEKSFAGVSDDRAKLAIRSMNTARANKSEDFETAKARGARTRVSGTGMNEQQSTADARSAPSELIGPGTEGFKERGPRNYKEAEYDMMNALKKVDHFKIQKLSSDISKLTRVILRAADPEAYSTISIRKKGHFLENSDIEELIAMLEAGADGLRKVEKLILQARGQKDPYARFR